MFALEITFEILPNKRHEFLQTARSLLASMESGQRDLQTEIFERVTAPERFLWSKRFGSREQLEDCLHSSTLHTLFGAIDILGKIESIKVFEGEPKPEILEAKLPSWAGSARSRLDVM